MKRIILTCMLLALATIAFAAEIEPFLGRWALFVPDGASWLEVKQVDNTIDADLLWYGGSVLPVADVYLDGETLVVTRVNRDVMSKDEQGRDKRVQWRTELFRFMFFGDQLVGKQIDPARSGHGVQITTFTGRKIADLPPAPDLAKVTFGAPITLFNGTDLTGWELMGENNANGWKAIDGALVNDPVQEQGAPHKNYGNLRTTEKFADFNLKLQVNVPKGSNSGIYLRGIYEVQVADTYGRELDSHNMGAIYSRIAPSVAAEKPAGEWQDLDITLCDRHVTVILNGVKTIDNQPLMGVTGGAMTACEFEPGPIYLQGDHGKVSYQNLVLKPILDK
ncbi:DUF1080 domain-containing protein [candidate division KSB1 bacterium]|nr:DUF1080 domain-containing protein [candidate division KSB1 bacterium]RQW01511.1 MAG: DUF1080 domain-containing protein [candidate division KSB1 bacterium]